MGKAKDLPDELMSLNFENLYYNLVMTHHLNQEEAQSGPGRIFGALAEK